jgi:predicted ATPase
MVIKTNWYVVTGSPCSGKSSVIRYLSFLGYHTVASPSRTYIDVEMSKGRKIEEIRADEADYQKRIFEMKIDQIKKLPKENLIFFERGLPDSIAYYIFSGANPASITEICREIRYKGVFLLERLPYKRDYARVESEEGAKRLHELIRKAYLGLGYDIIEIPVKPIDERVRMILGKI